MTKDLAYRDRRILRKETATSRTQNQIYFIKENLITETIDMPFKQQMSGDLQDLKFVSLVPELQLDATFKHSMYKISFFESRA